MRHQPLRKNTPVSVRHALPLHIRYRQQARSSHQIPKTTNETAVYAAKSMEELLEQAVELQVILVQRTFTACRAIGCVNLAMTGGTSPRNGSYSTLLAALERYLAPIRGCTTFRRIASTSGLAR